MATNFSILINDKSCGQEKAIFIDYSCSLCFFKCKAPPIKKDISIF